MTLPTFLGIGAPRSGSTWLYNLLATHPDVYMHPKRKDIRFFNIYYNRGISWYENFFPKDTTNQKHIALGEYTPDYLYDKNCAKRIADISSITKLILIIRNPTERLFSKYKDFIVNKNYKESFEDFIKEYPEQVEQGFYSHFIAEYLHYFSRDQILVLIFEESVTNVEQTKKHVGQFLNISPDKFPKNSGVNKINASSIPRASSMYSLAYCITSLLRNQCGMDRFVDWYLNIGRRMGARRVFGKSSKTVLLSKPTEQYLKKIYSNEVQALGNVLGRNLSCWH